jgi:hypothetical protein
VERYISKLREFSGAAADFANEAIDFANEAHAYAECEAREAATQHE